MTADERAELRAKVAAMTPGKIRPWDTKTGGSHLEIIPPNEREFHLRLYVACWLKDTDAEAIAAVMNAAPALLDAADEVATLRAENANLRDELAAARAEREQAVQEEREACAAEADMRADLTVRDEWDKGANWCARRIATHIRARGTTPKGGQPSSDTPPYTELSDAYTEVSHELTEAHLALENFAGVYDAFLVAKGVAWCKHWESVPLHQLFSRDGVQFRMPTLEDCRRAKAAVEGETTMPAPSKGEQQS